MQMRVKGRAASAGEGAIRATALLLVCLACVIGTSLAEERRVIAVTGVQVQARGPAAAIIVISADGALSDYQSFTLSDPPRLVIDLPHARREVQRVNLPAASPIVKVRTTQYREGPDPVVRLVFDLGQVLPYRLEVSGNKMQILLSEEASEATPRAEQARQNEKPVAQGELSEAKKPVESAAVPPGAPPAGEPAASSVESAAPTAGRDEPKMEKQEEAKTQGTAAQEGEKAPQTGAEPSPQLVTSETPPVPSPPSRKRGGPKPTSVGAAAAPAAPLKSRPVKISGLQVQAGGPAGATIVISADGALSDYRSFTLPDPPRLVIDLSNARHAISRPVSLPIASPILKVRTTQYREKPIPIVRLVFDLSTGLMFKAEKAEQGLRIVLGEPGKESIPPSVIAEAPKKRDSVKKPVAVSRKSISPPPTMRAAKSDKKSPPLKETPLVAVIPIPATPPEPQAPLGAPAAALAASALGKGRLSLDFKNADLDDLLRLISEVSGLNVVAAHGLGRTARDVTVRLMNVEWRQALDIILRTKNLSYEQDGNLIYVGSKADIQKAKEERKKDIEEVLRIEEQREKNISAEEERRRAKEAAIAVLGSGRLSLDVKDRDLDELLREVSKVSGLNIVAAHGLQDRKARDVTIRLNNVEWRQALDLILRTKNLSYEQDGNVIYVGSKSEIQKAKEDRAKDIEEAALKSLRIEEENRKAEEAKRKRDEAKKKAEEEERLYAAEPKCTKLIQLAYTKASEVKKHLDPLKTRRGSVELDERTNTIIVNDLESACVKMAAVAKELDAPPKEPFITKLIPFNYAKAAELRVNLAALKTPQGTVVVDERSSRVVIKDLPPVVERMETFLKQVDIPTPQVLIEARIVEASRSFSQSLGVQWGGLGVPTKPGQTTGVTTFGGSGSPGSIQFPSPTVGAPPFLDPANPIPFAGPVPLAMNLPAIASGANPFVLGATIGSLANRYLVGLQLSAAEREGRIRTLSSPRVATQDNEEAEIKQGTQVPFTTIDSSGRTVVSFQDAFIKLKVKPHITPDGRVSMKVEAERSFAGDRIDFSGGFAFPINTRKATTNVLVPNGSTVVIGGLLQSTEQIATDRVPVMGQIPILGWLFKRRSIGPEERVELLIFLTPSVLQEAKL